MKKLGLTTALLLFGVLQVALCSQTIITKLEVKVTNSSKSSIEVSPLRALTTTVGNSTIAKTLARALVERKLAAIVNIFPDVVSMYEWKGNMGEHSEVFLLIITHEARVPSVEDYIRKRHNHLEPGLFAIPVIDGSSSFMKWAEEQTTGNRAKNNSNVTFKSDFQHT